MAVIYQNNERGIKELGQLPDVPVDSWLLTQDSWLLATGLLSADPGFNQNISEHN